MADDGRRRFGRLLKEARLSRGMSQAEVAEKADVSQSNVSGWEAGNWAPEPDAVFALERALRCPAGYLSQHLGYVPVGLAEAPPVDVEAAIMASPVLDELDKGALLGLYKELARRGKRRRR